MLPDTTADPRQLAPAGPTHKVGRTTHSDAAGRPVMVADRKAPHQLTIVDAPSHVGCLIGCNCTDATQLIAYNAPRSATQNAYNSLRHREPFTYTFTREEPS